MESEVRGASLCFYLVLQILHLLLAIGGVILIALSIWIWVIFTLFNIFELIFMCLGVLTLFLVATAWFSRKSLLRIQIYNYLLLAFFTIQIACIIPTIIMRQTTINDVYQHTKTTVSYDRLNKNYGISIYFLISIICFTLLVFAANQCYIRSAKQRDFEGDYETLNQEGRRITIQEIRMHNESRLWQRRGTSSIKKNRIQI